MGNWFNPVPVSDPVRSDKQKAWDQYQDRIKRQQEEFNHYAQEKLRRQAELDRISWSQSPPKYKPNQTFPNRSFDNPIAQDFNQILPKQSEDQPTSCVYILRLKEDKWYVGWTTDLTRRIQEHRNGQGSVWTQKYPPVEQNPERVIYTQDPFDEDKYTKETMARYGIVNVRGGSYVTLTLSKEVISLLEKEIRLAGNRCLRCGRSGHYVKNCLYDTTGELSGIVKSTNQIAETTKPIDIPQYYDRTIGFKQPINGGKFWTENEEKILVDRFKSRLSITQIAELHGRTVYAIECRLKKLNLIPG